MSCKYLVERLVQFPAEVGNNPVPRYVPEPYCDLKRDPGIIGWATKCENLPVDGPCWYWLKEYGPETPDPDFK